MGKVPHLELETYIRDVCQKVRNREAHRLIREDITYHFIEAYEEELAGGLSEQEAVTRALARLGPPDELGIAFQQIHRRRVDWLSLCWLGFLCIFGAIVTLYTLRDMPTGPQSELTLWRSVFVDVIGVALGMLFFFVSPRYLRKSMPAVLAVVFVPMLATVAFGWSDVRVNGPKALWGFDVFGVAPYALAPSLAILLADRRWHVGWRAWVIALVIGGTQLLFGLGRANLSLLILDCAWLIVLLRQGRLLWRVAVIGAVSAAFVGYRMMVVGDLYRFLLERLVVPFHAADHRMDIGYQNYQTQWLVRHAGWFGHGVGVHPYILLSDHGAFAFAELMNLFGWSAGLALGLGTLWFISRLFTRGRRLRHPVARQVFIALMVLLVIQLGYPMLMGLGIFPIFSIQMPLVSGSPLATIPALCAFGLLFNLLKRTEFHSAVRPCTETYDVE
ncbi:permease prefix domain 1-containing protein [Alicyclobacillus acidoterrestris]|uniref:Permease prefix domain 1-containing protein n=1 Tax=Alicyclobacillus acidoterrestris (strain ATCC 49025 / DSM 3922 / CIP 106132 / NCIMB 13137 / GD3B) TaxID=1356854 RepID=T0BTQ1_ALIAG|nr:permease prefix domain 1-containing protein [Alicyclobacillus acidoterrestris]EPZ44179.1 hypothetical protein N007_11690 [Alicyclobacillus acidoterrestris ATCC 49025]UNO49692.1 permease prefix domain 1-containing protein [Alicyclobacillus acidoterrestris]